MGLLLLSTKDNYLLIIRHKIQTITHRLYFVFTYPHQQYMRTKTLLPLFFALCASLFFACGDKDGNSEPNFDRSAMLRNYADNLIKPAYNDLSTEIAILKTAINAFVANPSVSTLNASQEAWLKTYKTWLYASAYNFGPAGPEGLDKRLSIEIATFPASSEGIETAISNGTTSVDLFNRDTRGFFGVEYLLFDLNEDNASIVSKFEASQDRKTYLINIINDIQTRVKTVSDAWNGTYFNEFVNNTGTDAGSSTSQLYNNFVLSFETIKNVKIELPLGKRPGQETIAPQLVEAYYSGESLEMMKIHLATIEAIYYGTSKTGTTGIGFKDYLETVEGGPELITSTATQLTNVKNALQAIPLTPSLSEQIQNNPQPIEEFRVELQKHTRFFKSEMSSKLGISITYSSGDGD